MKVYVTRDASVTYFADVPENMRLEEVEARCHKYGFEDDNLGEIEWEVHNISTFDNVEAYAITQDQEVLIEGDTVVSEVTLKEWSLG